MKQDNGSLHGILKDQTRRNIIYCLSSGSLAYLELMNHVGVTNTGRFNYHLKMLDDLVEKGADGKYFLTEKGELAFKLLEGFPHTEAAPHGFTRFKHRLSKLPKKTILAAVLVLILGLSLITVAVPVVKSASETLTVQWQQFLPGVKGNYVIQTADGGYLALGINASVQKSNPAPFVNPEPILVKTDSSGNLLWHKTYPVENGTLELSHIIQTSDGGYTLGGVHRQTVEKTVSIDESFDAVFQVSESKINLIKIDSEGNVQWSKLLMGNNDTELGWLPDVNGPSTLGGFIQTSDNGYAIVTGYTHTMYIAETWFVKTDAAGNLELNKTIVPNDLGSPHTLVQTEDGYVIGCTVLGRGGSGGAVSIIKIDFEGNVQWYKQHREDATSLYGESGAATSDGGYIIGGSVYARQYGLVLKADAQGDMVWRKNYSYANYPSTIQSITQTNDCGYIFVGSATNSSGEVNPSTRFFTWIATIDSSGNIQAQTAIETGSYLLANPASIIQASDGGYVFVGAWTESYQAVENHFWLVKINAFQAVPSFVWSSLQLAVAVAVIILEIAIGMLYKKRKIT